MHFAINKYKSLVRKRLLNYIMYIPFGMIRVSSYCDFKQTIMNKNIMICTNSGSF